MTSSKEIHPQIQAFLREVNESTVPPASSLSVQSVRESAGSIYSTDSVDSVGDVHDFRVPGRGASIPLRVYFPEDVDGPLPALVYFHGGGWVIGGLEMADPLCRALSNETGSIIISVDYRLAPEHKFPAGLEDCYTALEWVEENAEELGIDPGRISVGGDSAGGNLAAAVSHLSRDRNGPNIRYQLLIYPVTDSSLGTDSMETFSEGYFMTRKTLEWFWEKYLRSDIDRRNAYASPLRSTDLTGMPTSTIITAGFDPLRDDGIMLRDKLRKSDNDVHYHHYDDVIHGFIQMLGNPDLDRAREAISDIGDDFSDVMTES